MKQQCEDSTVAIQQTFDGATVTRLTCKPPHYPEQTCETDVERVITVYYGGPAMTTIEWQICEDHAEDVRETGEVKEDRPYRELEDGFDDS
jgi:hypothetical protein